MGATAFRPRKSVRGQYTARKERRRAARHVPASRSHESPPWYCFPLTAAAYEAKLNAERFAAERAARERAEELRTAAAEFEQRKARIAEKRQGSKFAPLSKLSGEGKPA